MSDLDKVFAYLRTFVDLGPGDLGPLADAARRESFAAKSIVFREGDEYRKVNFILSGLVKKSYTTEDGKEFIKEFSWEGQITTPYASILRGVPATYTMETLEPTEVLTIDYAIFENLSRMNPKWLAVGKALADFHFVNREMREMELLKYSAPERLAIFRRRFPNLLGRLRKQDIAAYLGITPVSLSRLEAEKD